MANQKTRTAKLTARAFLHWQRLILGQLAEKVHRGVLTGAPVTDIRFTLVSGRAHQKHTEGGDFRQATYRAVRQGLMKAKSVLLEPWYAFRLELPAECVGRAITDIQRMQGDYDPPETDGAQTILRGAAPVRLLRGYPNEVTAHASSIRPTIFPMKNSSSSSSLRMSSGSSISGQRSPRTLLK